MAFVTHKAKRLVKVVTVDGARFVGEVADRNKEGLYLRIQTPMERERFVFVSHHAISHLEIEGWM